MKDTIELKKKLMKQALNDPKVNHYAAHAISAVDAIYTIYEQRPEAYIYADFTPYKYALRLFGKALSASSVRSIVELAFRDPTNFYMFLLPESDLEKSNILAVLMELLVSQPSNFGIVVVSVNAKDSGRYFPVFKHKSLPEMARPYQVYFTIPGEGWGELENTKEVLTAPLTKSIYDSWLVKIDEIEAEKDKLLKEAKENANNEHEVSEREG
jgi:hypothetical protein